MARKRMIDPNFWTDEKIGECSIEERLLFMGLISNADDEGYGRANPKLLKSLIFPYDEFKPANLEKWLLHLSNLNIVILYKYDGQTYYNLPNFLKHQTINRPSKSKFPHLEDKEIEILTEYSLNTHEELTLNIKEKKIKENNIKKEKYKKEKESKIHFADFVSMTNAEHEKLISTYGKEFADQCITVLDNYKGSSGKNYKSDYRAILSWVVDKVSKEKGLNNPKKSNFKERKYNNLDFLYSNLNLEDMNNGK